MNIAVIGGGASGLATAYLLDAVHHVTLLEREEVLGGNIRTLGGNVPCSGLPRDVRVDAGVIEFERDRFPAFHALMEELDIELGTVPGGTGLYLADGRRFLSPGHARRSLPVGLERQRTLAHLLPLARSRRRFLRTTAKVAPEALRERPLSAYLDDGVLSLWLRLLVMYAYSIPAEETGDAPAQLAVPMLRSFLGARSWTRVRGGVYRYVEALLGRLRGECRLGTQVEGIRRTAHGVEVESVGRGPESFDAVVFATTPDQVLALLEDPTDAETRRFAAWRSQTVTTAVHTDADFLRRRHVEFPSEFDLLETARGYGYNAYLNRLVGVGDEHGPHYQLAFDLGEEIDRERVVHVQRHVTPRYTVAAYRSRDEIVATNGENHTFHAGAYLGNGLHEGAVRSALEVSRRLGGRNLRF